MIRSKTLKEGGSGKMAHWLERVLPVQRTQGRCPVTTSGTSGLSETPAPGDPAPLSGLCGNRHSCAGSWVWKALFWALKPSSLGRETHSG